MKHGNLNPEYVPAQHAQKELGINRRACDALVRSGVLGKTAGGISVQDIKLLATWKSQKVFTTGKANIDFQSLFALAVPLTDPKLDIGLGLSASNGLSEARDQLAKQGISIVPGQLITGWWSCGLEYVDLLVKGRYPILGVTGGFVVSGGWVEALAATSDYRQRRAFLVTEMTAEELANFRGHVPEMNQSGIYVA
ncbi:hypothetical protein NMP99_11915 [Glutamicibacter mishrai]|uniref:hypothetical protein n=1 Tax=Glutamicibacter mishrai TaxID=1775880 RepID=UPI0020CF0E14|nr:hypothetical protein [Glutamicibacter mishrai]UTT38733.1 hypothetical protein NMP99_11915 [Glutamicibacter mishrai]